MHSRQTFRMLSDADQDANLHRSRPGAVWRSLLKSVPTSLGGILPGELKRGDYGAKHQKSRTSALAFLLRCFSYAIEGDGLRRYCLVMTRLALTFKEERYEDYL